MGVEIKRVTLNDIDQLQESRKTELQDDKALEIERIYVLKEFQWKKIGQLLPDLSALMRQI